MALLRSLLLVLALLTFGADAFTSTTRKAASSPSAFVRSPLFGTAPLASSVTQAATQQKLKIVRKQRKQPKIEPVPAPRHEFVPAPAPSEEERSTASSSRAVYTNRHSSKDWWYNLKSLPQSSVLREIRNPVMSVGVWGFCVSLLYKTLPANLAAKMIIPSTAHSFLTSALGLLLVFRTNSAYQRFLEGRKIWEDILTISRNLSRMVHLYGDAIGPARATRINSLVAAFPYLLRHHIRSGCLCETSRVIDEKHRIVLKERMSQRIDTRYEGDKQGIPKENTSIPCYADRRELPWSLMDHGDTLKKVAQSQNRPLWVCDRLGKEIMGVKYDDAVQFTSRERLALLSSIDKLATTIGQCERIHHTAVPLNYARHALRSLTMFLFTLPFCLVKDLGFVAGPAAAISAWLLFGVYQIGHSIEDPFQGSLRLSILCDNIRRDVLGLDSTAFDDDFETDEEEFIFPVNVAQATQRVEEFIISQPNNTWKSVAASSTGP